jgi:NAD(P)-dependent dehydrogenase (short-subunit alcohol dehydrogenase family)
MKKSRVVLITGAAGGMGTLLAKRFLTHGDTVIATDTVDEAFANEQEGK